MKKIIISILAVLAFSWTPVVSAEQSPESVVTCVNAGENYFIYSKSISGAINEEQCKTSNPEYTCSPCISSLEDQGCKVVDVIVENVAGETNLTYLLSCTAP